jgi:hypothetical protein
MLANYMGYDFIGSDINITYAEQNATWRKTNKFYTPDKQFDIFTHDITQTLENQLEGKDVLIVSEGRLGPIVMKNTSSQDIKKFQEQVLALYNSFLERIKEL